MISCESLRREPLEIRYKFANAESWSFNGIVYDHRVLFIIPYKFNGETNTAFVYRDGGIGGEWAFKKNSVEGEVTLESIQKLLSEIPITKYVEKYQIHRVAFMGFTEIVFPTDAQS